MHAIDNTSSEDIRAQSAERLGRRRTPAIDLRGELKPAQSETRGDADAANPFIRRSRGVDHQLRLVESHVAPK